MDNTAPPVETVDVSRLYCSPSNPRLNDQAVPHVAAAPPPEDGDPGEGGHRPPRRRVEVRCPSCDQTRRIIHELATEPPLRNCRACSSRVSPRRPRTGTTTPCATCEAPVYRPPGGTTRRFCSQKCAGIGKRRYAREERACWTCGSEFVYAPKPFSNSSGHYCSTTCRDDGYLGVINGNPARVGKTDRRGWKSRRNRFVRHGHDFCAVCGVREGRLHVHHIEGYRNVAHDDTRALVTVCTKHHHLLEPWTRRIMKLDPAGRHHAAMCILGCLGDSWAYHAGRALTQGGGR